MKLNKILTCVMASFIAVAMPWQASNAASSSSKKTSTATKSTSKASSSKTSKSSSSQKSTATKSSGKASSSKASKSTGKSSSRHSSGKTAQASSETHCKTVKVKTRKGYQNKKECSSPAKSARNTEPREPALTGGVPAAPSADAPVPEAKARSTPDRAYAVDGSTFFYQGRKFHVKGVNPDNIDTNSDLAKQKLQMALDKGSISTDSLSEDSSGTTDAVVRINGRNLADMLKTPE